jgi:hypothetical protein
LLVKIQINKIPILSSRNRISKPQGLKNKSRINRTSKPQGKSNLTSVQRKIPNKTE